MIMRNSHTFAVVAVLTTLTLLLTSCTPQPTIPATSPSSLPPTVTQTALPSPARTRVPVPTATVNPLPALTLNPKDGYFSLSGKPAFLFSRNPAGYTPNDWEAIAGMAHAQGNHFLRLATNSAAKPTPATRALFVSDDSASVSRLIARPAATE